MLKDRKCILIIEDNDATRELYKAFLSSSYIVYTADTGLHAVERLSNLISILDLVVTDHNMPIFSGSDVSGLIRKSAARPLPIICVTSHLDREPEEYFKFYDSILLKPFHQADLLSAVRDLIGS